MTQLGVIILMVATEAIGAGARSQQKPDFSGKWTLVDLVDQGPGRGGRSGASTSDIRGSALNCASECTIAQTATTLTVSRPANNRGVTPPAVVLSLIGEPQPIKHVTVQWNGDKLLITRAVVPALAVTETLSFEGKKLRIYTTFSAGDSGPITMIYERR